MGRREKWYSKIKKVLHPGSKPRIKAKSKKSSSESGSKRFCNQSHLSQVMLPAESVPACHLPLTEEGGTTNDQDQLPQLSETAPVLAPKIASGIRRHIPVIVVSHSVGKLRKEDTAATRIQTAYRGYLARRTLRALRGLVRLKFLVHGQSVKRQATNTLQCMQALARVQSQVRSRRVQMSKENQALQKQLLLKNSKKHTPFRNSDDWKDCAQSKQRDEEKMKKKHEAALRRERTLAYSSVHQQTWKSSPKRASNMNVMDPDNPNWGWSWLERWMAGRPWVGRNDTDEGLDSRPEIPEVEATKEAPALHRPPPNTKTAAKPPPTPTLKITSMAENNKPGSTRMRLSNASGSDRLEKNRRYSFGGPSAREYESSASSNSPRSQSVPAKSVNTRPRLQSPLAMEQNGAVRKSNAVRQAGKLPSHSVRHSNPRRHSSPPKTKNTSITQQHQNITAEISYSRTDELVPHYLSF